MTAEIAVLNKTAVALAADSAVTISRGGRAHKTYEVNKLFMLSKFHPVGIMIYDNASILGVPWETTIKAYRKRLGDSHFSTLKAYADDFINFLSSFRPLFPETLQSSHFAGGLVVRFSEIHDDVTETVEAITKEDGGVDVDRVLEIRSSRIKEMHEYLHDLDRIDGLPEEFESSLMAGYSKEFNEAVLGVFGENTQLSEDDLKLLREIAAAGYSHGEPPLGQTGIVIAGFGEDEYFPSVVTHTVFGITMNRAVCRFEVDSTHHVNGERPQDAALIPFAQRDVVATFMQGVDPQMMAMLLGGFHDILKSFCSQVQQTLSSHNQNLSNSLYEELSIATDKAMDEISDTIQSRIDNRHVQPLLSVLGVLPKRDLADTAAALVELTAVKRKVSSGIETVGGPIDVAVISKGDGFVWISRKHYFDPSLNPQFPRRYMSK